MVVIPGIVMFRPGNVVRMAMFGLTGTVVGLGKHGPGTLLDRHGGSGKRQRQGNAEGRQQRPDPPPCYRPSLQRRPSGLTPIAVLPLSCLIPPGGIA
jgi:hypothetical protein